MNRSRLFFPMAALLCAALATVTGCTSGGGDDDDDALRTDTCGDIGLGSRIINGTPCTSGSAVVRLDINFRNGGGGLCSGTLITNRHILTAAHCFLVEEVLSASALVGSQRVAINRVAIHPGVNVVQGDPGDRASNSIINDLAIAELNQSVNAPTMPLLASRSFRSGDNFSIYGYGIDDEGGTGILRSGEMEAVEVTDQHIFAEYDGDGSNSCNGDSGGPALAPVEADNPLSTYAIVGLTSSGTQQDCQKGDLSLFANTQSDSALNFILSVAPNARVI